MLRVQADFKGKYGIDDEEIKTEIRELRSEIAEVSPCVCVCVCVRARACVSVCVSV